MKEQGNSPRAWPVFQPMAWFIFSLALPQLGIRHWAECCSSPSAGQTAGLPFTPGPSPFHLIYYAIDPSFLPLFCTCVQVCGWMHPAGCAWMWMCAWVCVRRYGCGYGCVWVRVGVGVGVEARARIQASPSSRSTLFSERKALTGLGAHYLWLELSSHRVGGGSYCLLAQCGDHWRL